MGVSDCEMGRERYALIGRIFVVRVIDGWMFGVTGFDLVFLMVSWVYLLGGGNGIKSTLLGDASY